MGRAVTLALWRAISKPPVELVVADLRMLDEELRIKDEANHIVEGTVTEYDPDIEKRKARARKGEEKERKRAEKLLKKKERGTQYGRFGK